MRDMTTMVSEFSGADLVESIHSLEEWIEEIEAALPWADGPAYYGDKKKAAKIRQRIRDLHAEKAKREGL